MCLSLYAILNNLHIKLKGGYAFIIELILYDSINCFFSS